MTNSYGAGGGGVAPATATASEESSDESNTDDENVHAHMHQILKVVEQARGQHFQRENPSQESPPPVNGTSPQPVFRDVAPSPGREPLSGSTGTKPPIVDRPSGSEICTWSSCRSAFVIFAWADDPKWGGTQATPRQGSTPWTVPRPQVYSANATTRSHGDSPPTDPTERIDFNKIKSPTECFSGFFIQRGYPSVCDCTLARVERVSWDCSSV